MIYLFFLLSMSIQPIECDLGQEVEVIYSVPAGLVVEKIESSSDWEITEQRNDILLLIPLALDTLLLPSMECFDDSISMVVAPPLLIISRTMPDSTWDVAMFPVPVPMNIPPGLPEDYLHALDFWTKWGQPSDRNYLIPISIGLLMVIATIAYLLYRRKRKGNLPVDQDTQVSTADKALDLLKSLNYANGNWGELYKEIEEILRDITAGKFSIVNRALTIYQLKRELGKSVKGRKFLEEADDILHEILLQRYASWGTTRLRSQEFIKKLSVMAGRWKK